MEDSEFEKAKAFNITETLEYRPNSIVIKTIIKKITGHISAIALDTGEKLNGKFSPFDVFILVVEGSAEVVIDKTSISLKAGHSVIIPAHSRNSIKAEAKCKIFSTMIKSGYE